MIHRMQTLDNPAQLPICAVCKKPVERAECDSNHDGSLTYRVFCHGDVETTTLTIQQMVAADITLAEAFAPSSGFADLARHLEQKYGQLFASEATGGATRAQQHTDAEMARLITQHGKETVEALILESQQHPEPALGFVKRRLNLGGAVIMLRSTGSTEYTKLSEIRNVVIHEHVHLTPYERVLFARQTYNSVHSVNLTAPLYIAADVKICKGCKTQIYGKEIYCDRHKVPRPARGRAAKQFYKGRGG